MHMARKGGKSSDPDSDSVCYDQHGGHGHGKECIGSRCFGLYLFVCFFGRFHVLYNGMVACRYVVTLQLNNLSDFSFVLFFHSIVRHGPDSTKAGRNGLVVSSQVTRLCKRFNFSPRDKVKRETVE